MRLVAQVLVGCVPPELAAHPLVQPLGKGLGEPVGERLEQDRRVVVEVRLERHDDALGQPDPAVTAKAPT
jgi:hypothetical protein